MKLSDKQLVLLSAAAQRQDGCLALPASECDTEQAAALKKLIKFGLVDEVPIRAKEPLWRETDTGRFTLKIAAEGLAALGIETEPSAPDLPASEQAPDKHCRFCPAPEPQALPRSGSKIGQVLELLRGDNGASADELCAATEWQPHTMRAALTGLRKRGYAVTLTMVADGRRAYRLPTAKTDAGSDGAASREGGTP